MISKQVCIWEDRCYKNEIISNVKQLITLYADLNMEDAARQLGIGVTALKKRCRQVGIHRWPHRQIKSLDNLIYELNVLVSKSEDVECIQLAITQLRYYKQKVANDPCYKIPDSVFRLRQAQFKVSLHLHKDRQKIYRDFVG
jgi:hypothetical protein